MFGKRQILIGLCAVVLSGSVIASDNSSALHGQDNAQTCVKPFDSLELLIMSISKYNGKNN